MSDVIYAMSNFFSQNLIKLNGKMQKEQLLLLYQYYFINKSLRKSIIGISGINNLQIN